MSLGHGDDRTSKMTIGLFMCFVIVCVSLPLSRTAVAVCWQSRSNSEWADTSQHGNWENFRNAKINGKPFVLTSNWWVSGV